MDEKLLLELATSLGYNLAMSGAETYRIEESIVRVLRTYGYEAEAFAIPNCMTVSLIASDGNPMTRMRRIGSHGNDLDAVERYSNLSRKICSEAPDPQVALEWLQDTEDHCIQFNNYAKTFGYFVGAMGFCVFYGGNIHDAIGAGFCGLLIWIIDLWMSHLQSTQFFRTIVDAFFAALLAYGLQICGFISNADTSIIGSLMILVPGLIFTNAMRDIMYGDTNSGINRIIQVCLIAAAIALGTAGALNLVQVFGANPIGNNAIACRPLIQNLACFVATIGFAILFNVHGPGGLLCCLGAVLSWSTYLLTLYFTNNVVWGNFVGGIVASVYAELMARKRKYPAISYLVISILPLIPGAGAYYTMTYAVQGQMDEFASHGMVTAAIAGAIALGILLVSSAFRLVATKRKPAQK